MQKARVDLGFGNELEALDQIEWTPPKRKPAASAGPDAVRLAEAVGFRSREPKSETKPASTPEQTRRRRTGRNVQFNIKARAETIEAFTRIADAKGWGFGETLEHAVALLENAYGEQAGS